MDSHERLGILMTATVALLIIGGGLIMHRCEREGTADPIIDKSVEAPRIEPASVRRDSLEQDSLSKNKKKKTFRKGKVSVKVSTPGERRDFLRDTVSE